MSKYESFKLLEKLYFVRTGGSKEELHAAEIIKKECVVVCDKSEIFGSLY